MIFNIMIIETFYLTPPAFSWSGNYILKIFLGYFWGYDLLKNGLQASVVHFSAERTGFEPVSRFRRLHAFQACLFSHSSIFP